MNLTIYTQYYADGLIKWLKKYQKIRFCLAFIQNSINGEFSAQAELVFSITPSDA